MPIINTLANVPAAIVQGASSETQRLRRMTVDQLIKHATGCTPDEAAQAAQTVCTDRQALAALTMACATSGIEIAGGVGLATFGVAEGIATSPTLVGAASGAYLAMTGIGIAKDGMRGYCSAVVTHVKESGKATLRGPVNALEKLQNDIGSFGETQ
jgi:hypothetical protein